MIAVMMADVDTRGGASREVTYGDVSVGEAVVGGHAAFCVNWVDVGEYSLQDSRRNSAQLLIVDRSDTGAGNVDLWMNYDKIQWDHGGIGIGYSDGTGNPAAFFELPGSRQPGVFLDSNATTGLVYNSVNSPLQAGRYIYPVRNGAYIGHAISGHVWQEAAPTPATGVFLQACAVVPRGAPPICRNATANASGFYVFNNLPDATTGGPDYDWNIVANPPGGSGLSTGTAGPIRLAGVDVENQDIVLHGPQPLPANASITTPSRGVATSGTPTTYWGDPMTVSVSGCSGGTASATFTVADGYTETITLVEGPPGVYTGTFAAPYPHHGAASVAFAVCGSNGSFDLYIDPSGVVRNTRGGVVAGAVVTLYRSDDPAGPFVQVPDGSAIMSPGNTSNPDATDAAGHFGWDVLAGYYRVRAQASDCHAPGDASTAYVESDVLPIPPPVTDLELTLECAGDAVPPVVAPHADVTTEATSAAGAAVAYAAPAATDDVDGPVPVTCAPASGSTFPLGSTTVQCTATDAAGNSAHAAFDVVVRDTTAPALTVPAATIVAPATSPAGAVVAYSASASDLVDGAVAPACSRASGSTFPIGDTTVTCTATDAHGNPASASFGVHVKGAAEQLADLAALIDGFDLKKGQAKKFEHRLREVVERLDGRRPRKACDELVELARKAAKESGKKLTAAEAAQIVSAAARIHAVLGC